MTFDKLKSFQTVFKHIFCKSFINFETKKIETEVKVLFNDTIGWMSTDFTLKDYCYLKMINDLILDSYISFEYKLSYPLL
jgi:hypothetical protein